ncbi:MAG TPA: amidohydrolase family protein [Vicinamibacterales bacterium]|jgi:cytosine/adenosine deaminase-related metal-dependent hydrolase
MLGRSVPQSKSWRAAWLLPIAAAPIRGGWVTTGGGRVIAVGTAGEPRPRETTEIDLGDVAILPGLVNAHTHLELSYLRGTIPPQPSFVPWVRQVIAAQRARTDPAAPAILAAMRTAIGDARRSGTAALGDISNTLVSIEALAGSPMRAVVFHELLGFRPDDARGLVAAAVDAEPRPDGARVQISLAAHAPYSVAPALFEAIRDAMRNRPELPISVHLAESPDEVEFLRDGTGAWRRLLDDVGAWNPEWRAPGVSPVAYLASLGFLDRRTLVVHGVQATRADLLELARIGATVVACPRSNVYTGVGRPPVEAFYASGVRVALGTDSLASAPDLNLFAELAALHQVAPSVPAARLLESATRHGAEALGLGDELGSIGPGRAADLLAVRIPPGTVDVEEYLVSGVEPEDVSWVHESIQR